MHIKPERIENEIDSSACNATIDVKSIKFIIVAYKLFIKCGKISAQSQTNIINNFNASKLKKDYDGWMALCNSFPRMLFNTRLARHERDDERNRLLKQIHCTSCKRYAKTSRMSCENS